MNDNIIKSIILEKKNYDNKYYSLVNDFVMKANELVDLSEGIYQLEHSIKLNQISLKDYILSSEVCKLLKNNNIVNYSVDELKKYFEEYELQSLAYVTPYKLAIELYEKLEQIEQVEKEQVDYELEYLSAVLRDLKKIKEINKEEYNMLYNDLVNQVKLLMVEEKEDVILVLNDIFYYYINGCKTIPLN